MPTPQGLDVDSADHFSFLQNTSSSGRDFFGAEGHTLEWANERDIVFPDGKAEHNDWKKKGARSQVTDPCQSERASSLWALAS